MISIHDSKEIRPLIFDILVIFFFMKDGNKKIRKIISILNKFPFRKKKEGIGKKKK